MEKLVFTTDENEEVEFYVLSDARIGGVNYILVTDSLEDDEAEALILKDTSSETDTDSSYEIVEDDNELEAVAKVFNEDLEELSLI